MSIPLYPQNQLPQRLRRDLVTNTTNPLRAGEPNRVFGKMGNLWSKQPKPDEPGFANYIIGKEFENIAVCLEDIEHLSDVTVHLREASDYTLKLLGKYMIIEIHSISDCFKSLGRASENLKRIGQKYRKDLSALDRKYKFPAIRNNLAAHKHLDANHQIGVPLDEQVSLWKNITADSLEEYLNCLNEYLGALRAECPREFKFNIAMNQFYVVPNAVSTMRDPTYVNYWKRDKESTD